MGMYTELNIGIRFKSDTPSEVIKTIDYMVSGKKDKVIDFPTLHPLFSTDRWDWMLRSAGSYYFSTKPMLKWEFDKIINVWTLSFVTNIKNYSNEWQHFLDFIAPHIEMKDGESKLYIGTYRYEENPLPTLVFIENGEVVMEEPIIEENV